MPMPNLISIASALDAPTSKGQGSQSRGTECAFHIHFSSSIFGGALTHNAVV